MKATTKVMFLFLFVVTVQVHGQSIKNEIQVIQGVYGIEKKKLLVQAMQLNEKEETKFWTIYEKYENRREELGEERLLIINDYLISFQRLDEESANQIALRCFKNDEETVLLHNLYYKIVKKEISALKAAQFMQIESYLQNVIRIQVQNQIPFIGQTIPVISQPVPSAEGN